MKKIILLIILTLTFTFFLNIGNVFAEEFNPLDVVKVMEFDVNKDEVVIEEIVYLDMTLDELAEKLNRSLSSTLTNKGMSFAKSSVKYGVDPYLVLAISLHETGCKWTCSRLVRQCNNVGGVKGSPSCNGGSYRSYESLDAGIDAFIRNIKYNYYDKGLDTAYEMQRKYTGGSTTWAGKVEKYIKEIKSK